MLPKVHLFRTDWVTHKYHLKSIIEKYEKRLKINSLYHEIDKACSQEWAFLFMAHDGFIILRPRHQNQQIYIEVLFAYCTGGNALARYQQSIIELTKCGSADFIQFYTKRKGFNKLAKKHNWALFGYHQQFTIWRLNLR